MIKCILIKCFIISNLKLEDFLLQGVLVNDERYCYLVR